MKYSYDGYNSGGQVAKGEIEAAGVPEAFEALRRQSIFATTVTEQRSAKGGSQKAGAGSLKELAAFCRQLAILISTRTPMLQALTVVERQTPVGGWRTTVGNIRSRVEEGESLSEAMAAHPETFDPVCRSMVAAGESGGMLDVMLKDLASLLRRQLSLRKSVVGALSYPAILITVSVGVVTVMLTFVLPQFQMLFDTLGANLPPTTRFLMAIGNGLRDYWYVVVPGVAGAVAGVVYSLRAPGARRRVDSGLLSLPKVGAIMRGFITARIARLLGVLLQSKIALLDALRLTREATTNSLYADLLEKAEDAVSKGQSLASVLADGSLVSPAVCEALSSGERSGQMGEVLVQVADYLDEDNDQIVKTLATIIEPLVLTALGLVVGFVAVSMFLPLFDLTAAGGAPGGSGGAP